VGIGSEKFFGGIHSVSLRRDVSDGHVKTKQARNGEAEGRRVLNWLFASLRRHYPHRFKGTISAVPVLARHP
jgi:hypothetical protein